MYRRFTTVVLAGFITLALSSGLWAAPKKQDAAAPPVPDGWVVIEENVWLQLQDEPDESFLEARNAFFLGPYAEAATDIRNGSLYLGIEAARATAKGDERLYKAIAHLDRLATDVEAGKVNSVRKLDHAFARADIALAKHYHVISKAMWSKKESKATAQALGVSTRHTRRAIHWAGTDVDQSTMDQFGDDDVYGWSHHEGRGEGQRH